MKAIREVGGGAVEVEDRVPLVFPGREECFAISPEQALDSSAVLELGLGTAVR
ncbi:hypothetical protein [Nocardia brasiliensis]|uniref:hypothetical protein n=1 Tax=Nocardia brasiliensis TaxID=37326 RepID=UPI00366C9532